MTGGGTSCDHLDELCSTSVCLAVHEDVTHVSDRPEGLEALRQTRLAATTANGLGSESGPGFHVRRVELCHQIDKTITKSIFLAPVSYSDD